MLSFFRRNKDKYTSWKYQKESFEKMYEEGTKEFQKRYHTELLEENKFVRQRIDDLFKTLFNYDIENLLDVGCGTGFYFSALSKYTKKIYGIDVSSLILKEAKKIIEGKNLKNIYFGLSISEVLPFRDNSFDCVFIFAVLHHLQNVDKAIAEAHRVLKKDGKCIVIEPNILNPAMFLFLCFKKHEIGILSLSKFTLEKKFQKLFKKIYTVPTTFQVTFTDPVSNMILSSLEKLPKPLLDYLAIHYVLIAEKE
ncbi:MAG: hypothetical protein A2042_01780 [Candidatus Schekmanbacteria bacterium GWA2_38_11]|uniref:Methyltransferase type 11 domain-containing protein n=1 Tax=Candidatus Schekmanbacteria bacterium GWA2_38_11 TaxID=1817876 RepID=A0A1F7RBD5_9BACT|nr:MAG: hypothetical protein A2042_01780 [Candidatus Schekmanbacteria bacterium GWA2_38_11]